jgi:acyl-CoA-binding protein
MELQAQFEQATLNSKNISSRPSNEQLLKLYAYYKQATEGDVKGNRPSGFDFKGQAKYDAWKKEIGKTNEEAKQAYIELVESLQ